MTKIEWYEKRVEIPGKTVYIPGKPIVVIDSSRSAREDSLIAALTQRGSLDSLARWRGQKFEAVFEDTINVVDSTGSFYLRELHTIEVDGATQIIKKAVDYLDGILKTSKVTVTNEVTVPDLWLTAIAFLLGVIVGIFL